MLCIGQMEPFHRQATAWKGSSNCHLNCSKAHTMNGQDFCGLEPIHRPHRALYTAETNDLLHCTTLKPAASLLREDMQMC
jgi:hypothetical protein